MFYSMKITHAIPAIRFQVNRRFMIPFDPHLPVQQVPIVNRISQLKEYVPQCAQEQVLAHLANFFDSESYLPNREFNAVSWLVLAPSEWTVFLDEAYKAQGRYEYLMNLTKEMSSNLLEDKVIDMWREANLSQKSTAKSSRHVDDEDDDEEEDRPRKSPSPVSKHARRTHPNQPNTIEDVQKASLKDMGQIGGRFNIFTHIVTNIPCYGEIIHGDE